MVVADLAIDKDNTVSVYCERDQTTKVEAMFNPPAAQPAPVHEPSREQTRQIVEGLQRCNLPDSKHEFLRTWIRDWTAHKITLTAAQRQWVGLTQQNIDIAFDDTQEGGGFDDFARAIEAKLRSKNT